MTGYKLDDIEILVTDDNQYIQKLIRRVLEPLSPKSVRFANDGKEALEVMRLNVPDLLITNWIMKPMDGLALVKALRDEDTSPNPYLPIIMLSSHTEAERVLEARDAGCHEVLAKPLMPKALYTRINLILDQPRPFVKTEDYFGPNRRRRDLPYNGDNRRVSEKQLIEGGGPRVIGRKKKP